MALDRYQLRQRYDNADWTVAFKRLFPLHHLLLHCVLPEDYDPSPQFAAAIKLTSRGQELLDTAPSFGADEQEQIVVSLGLLGDDELFIDLEQTDFDSLHAAMSNEIKAGRIRYPFLLGRDLYDRYFDDYPESPRVLDPIATQNILKATGQGVFQLGNQITGPLGLLVSQEERFLPPTLTVPLTHCSDPTCDVLHPVSFSTSRTRIAQLYTDLRHWMHDYWPGQAEWSAHWHWLVTAKTLWADFHPGDLYSVLGNCLAKDELALLVARLFPHLASIVRDSGWDKRAPKDVTFALDRSQLLQLALCASDDDISHALDDAILAAEIPIVAGEVREPPYRLSGGRGARSQGGRLSEFGISFRRDVRDGPLRLRRLLLRMAQQPDMRADLEWQLQEHPGATLQHQIDQAVETANLETLLNDLVLARRDGFEELKRYVRYGNLSLPKDVSTRQRLVQEALWKLGFDLRHETPLSSFLRWHRELEAMVESSELRTDADREKVRSAAVNYFVAVESILDVVLSFTTWALLNDHWSLPRPTRFVYNIQNARSYMRLVLEGTPYGQGESLRLSDDGRNELFALQTGFALLRRRLEGLKGSDEVRPASALPPWSDLDTFRSFPFRHLHPWLDLSEPAKSEILEVLQTIPAELSRGDVLKVRNRVPHAGGEFPSAFDWRTALEAVGNAIGVLRKTGLVPAVYTPVERVDDIYGRSRHIFSSGEETIVVVEPSSAIGLGMPPRTVSQVLVRVATLKDTNEFLRFSIQQPSPFTAMWQGYPRRRGLPPAEEESDEFTLA